jgi:hypothetical protein
MILNEHFSDCMFAPLSSIQFFFSGAFGGSQ